MTTPEKCRMLLEVAKKDLTLEAAYDEYTSALDPTTVQEICEAYLQSQEDLLFRDNLCGTRLKRIQELENDIAILDSIHLGDRVLIKKLEARIQELEAALGWKDVDTKKFPINYKILKYSQTFMEELCNELKEDNQLLIDSNAELVTWIKAAGYQLRHYGATACENILKQALAKARKVGG